MKICGHYVHNASDKWMKCIVMNGSKRHEIKCIPPKSARAFPEHFANPELTGVIEINPVEVQRLTSKKNQGHQEIIQPLEINMHSIWEGTLNWNKVEKPLRIPMVFEGSSFYGGSQFNDHLTIISGNCDIRTHQVALIIVNDENKVSKMVSGHISKEGPTVSLMAACEDVSIKIQASLEATGKFEVDSRLTGNYLYFKVVNDNQIEGGIHIEALDTGIMYATSTNGRVEGPMFGFRSEDSTRAIFCVKKGDSPLIYIGEISPGDDVFISGSTNDGRAQGNFNFIKSVE